MIPLGNPPVTDSSLTNVAATSPGKFKTSLAK